MVLAMPPKKHDPVREEAILICAIAASLDDQPLYATVAIDSGASREAQHLAEAAWLEAYRQTGLKWTRDTDGEAEALLQTGWSP